MVGIEKRRGLEQKTLAESAEMAEVAEKSG